MRPRNDQNDVGYSRPRPPTSKWYRLLAAAAANIENCASGIVLCRLRPSGATETGAAPGRYDDCHELHTIEGYRVRAKDRIVELAGRNDWRVLDTETAGLDDEDEAISVAVVATTGERLFHMLIRLTALIHPRASAVNGLTDEVVADAAAFADVYPWWVEVLAGRHVLAYNADFDRRMLAQSCERYGLPVIWGKWEYVMELYAAARNRWSRRNGFVWCKLGEACEREGVRGDPDYSFHEARADAQAARLLVLAVGGSQPVLIHKMN